MESGDQSRRLRGASCDTLQGVDTDEPLLYPKVIESLLGTRLRGREFGASPLVRRDAPRCPDATSSRGSIC